MSLIFPFREFKPDFFGDVLKSLLQSRDKRIELETGMLMMLLFCITFFASKAGPGGTNFGKTL
jgi:hypothetical protein